MNLSASVKDSLVHLLLKKPKIAFLNKVQKNYDAFIAAQLCRIAGRHKGSFCLLYVLGNEPRLNELYNALKFFAPEFECIRFAPWDCQPYDKAPPNAEIMNSRMKALEQIEEGNKVQKTRLILTTVNAILQKIPTAIHRQKAKIKISKKQKCDFSQTIQKLSDMGYKQTSLVYSDGYFSVRGGIIDIFPFFAEQPVRVDFDGEMVENIQIFDTKTQITTNDVMEVILKPISELYINFESRKIFANNYLRQFGVGAKDDLLYQTINEGKYPRAAEHWLPLFSNNDMETFLDIVKADIICLDENFNLALENRFAIINANYQARKQELNYQQKEKNQTQYLYDLYRPLPSGSLYLEKNQLEKQLEQNNLLYISQGYSSRGYSSRGQQNQIEIDCKSEKSKDFTIQKKYSNKTLAQNIFDEIDEQTKKNKKIYLTVSNKRSEERIIELLKDGGIEFYHYNNLLIKKASLSCGFSNDEFSVISDQDIFGKIQNRSKNRKLKQNKIKNLNSISPGDYIVHSRHGIGKFEQLANINIDGQPHECLAIVYQNNDKLYLPIENFDLISRYGQSSAEIILDRLGSASFQERKARLKKNLLAMAEKIITIASKRQVANAPKFVFDKYKYDNFCDAFIHEETESQLEVTKEILSDLASGRLMDRLVCGDAGFGKTEVAIRAAFAAFSQNYQTAVLVPTTLLARQHSKSFSKRFQNMGASIQELSRMTVPKKAKIVKEQIKNGKIDIVIGTHALLAENIKFKKLGLVIIDEEQHFGVKHKEKLKNIANNIHILSLSATPIPRTLQMAFAGIKSLSFVSIPPMNRLAVRSFVIPFDSITLRQAILNEKQRGGQIFFIVPRIADLDDIMKFISAKIPEIKFQTLHGKMKPTQIDNVMNDFYDRKCDLLIATTIIESGIDIPNANTMIVYKANMFGVSQLYQLRGRVGRGDHRGYVYFTTPKNLMLKDNAIKRLEILQELEAIGAGFQVANKDLDIRGGGNLLGDSQAGHIKEVGFELYQKMLKEALKNLKDEKEHEKQHGKEHGKTTLEDEWTPEIKLGVPVQIPKAYITDTDLRIDIYQRLAKIDNLEKFHQFEHEIQNRFGKLPPQLKILLDICQIKFLCKLLNIEKIETGKKAVLLTFYQKKFPEPEKIIEWTYKNQHFVKLRSDHKIVIKNQNNYINDQKHQIKLFFIKKLLTKMKQNCL